MAEKAFAFRMSPELKDAAKVLSKAKFSEWWEEDGQKTGRDIWLTSINDALLYLVKAGAKQTIATLDSEIIEAKVDCEFWQELARFFIDHPEREIVRSSDFPDDSPVARRIIGWREGNEDHPELDTSTREEVFSDLSYAQKTLKGRMDARAALSEVVA